MEEYSQGTKCSLKFCTYNLLKKFCLASMCVSTDLGTASLNYLYCNNFVFTGRAYEQCNIFVGWVGCCLVFCLFLSYNYYFFILKLEREEGRKNNLIN